MPGRMKDPYEQTKKVFAENDLRTIWRKMKAQALTKVGESLGSKVKANLDSQFSRGLGPMLDEWATQAGKLPNVETSDLEDIYRRISRTIAQYQSDISSWHLPSQAGMILAGTLKHLQEELERQRGWYQDVGLWR